MLAGRHQLVAATAASSPSPESSGHPGAVSIGLQLVHLTNAPRSRRVSLNGTPLVGWIGLTGVVAMLAVIAVKGRSHRHELADPAPFRGPADFRARILAEQCITLLRFVLTGGFARAWRSSHPSGATRELRGGRDQTGALRP